MPRCEPACWGSSTPRFAIAGFTLIELLVVIAIIGILSSVVLASLNGARESARDSRRQSDLNNIRTALSLYANQEGDYPQDGLYSTNGSDVLEGSDAMNVVPRDPSQDDPGASQYESSFGSTGDDYDVCLAAGMEGDAPENSAAEICDSSNGGPITASDVTDNGGEVYYLAI